MSRALTVSSRRLEDAALTIIGKKWSHLGRGPETYDCVGTVEYIYRIGADLDLREHIPETYSPRGDGTELNERISRMGFAVVGDGSRQPGDLLTFFVRFPRNCPHHVGVLIDGDDFAHGEESAGVVIDKLSLFWERRIVNVWRYPWLRLS